MHSRAPTTFTLYRLSIRTCHVFFFFCRRASFGVLRLRCNHNVAQLLVLLPSCDLAVPGGKLPLSAWLTRMSVAYTPATVPLQLAAAAALLRRLAARAEQQHQPTKLQRPRATFSPPAFGIFHKLFKVVLAVPGTDRVI